MKKIQYRSRSGLIAISLGVLVLMAACAKTSLSNNMPPSGELPTQISLDSVGEITSNYLICPTIPDTAPPIPPGPYDEELGDCALRGKSTEIEAWLVALEEIAAGCEANREPYWAAALAARDRLDERINEFVVYELAPIEVEQPAEEEPDRPGMSAPPPIELIESLIESSCPIYELTDSTIPSSEPYPDRSHIYTVRLIRIGENVGKYCTMIDELIQPLWYGCDEINFYQDCQDPNLELYHMIIERNMIQAQLGFDAIGLFFTESLQQNGWDAFRTEFTETSIYCPIEPAVGSKPTFEFSMNTFCRRGPSSEYGKVATFLSGQEVKIRGINQGEPRWWWVAVPGSSENCWISDSTGSPKGYLEDIEFVPAPALIQGETCSEDMDQSACEAVGGTWAGKDTPNPYCDCP